MSRDVVVTNVDSIVRRRKMMGESPSIIQERELVVYNIHILQTRKTGRVVAAAAASVLCCMGAVFPATIGVTAASADEPVELVWLVVNGGSGRRS